MTMRKIGILYICTGPYARLFEDFYITFKQHFLTGKAEFVFYVWTDSDLIKETDDVKLYPHSYAGYPWDTLLRFEMFLEAKNDFEGCDYLYFFNANALFLEDIGEEILPITDDELVAMNWHIYNNISFLQPYEMDKKSVAYIPPFTPPYRYYSGQFNGGTKKQFVDLIETCAKDVRKDMENGLLAKSLDQDYLNHYLHYHKCRDFPADYMMPQEWVKPNQHPKIVFRTKDNKVYNKPIVKKSLFNILKGKLIHIRNIVCWNLRISVKSPMSVYLQNNNANS